MHCPISRTKTIVITGNSNLLRSTSTSNGSDNTIFRNVSIVFPNDMPVWYNQEMMRQRNNHPSSSPY